MITIHQAPTFPNIANNDLVWVVSSNQQSQPQFQYVIDIKDENGNLIQRVKQQPNPSGYGVFNLGNLISYQFDNEYDVSFQQWYASPYENVPIPAQKYIASANNGGAVKEINVLVGEEYAVSTTATSSLYNGNGSLGNPAVSSSIDWQLYINGVLDTNDRFPLWSGSWNFTTEYDKYRQPPTGSDMPWDNYMGKGKWNPMPIWGFASVGNLGANQRIEFDAEFPPAPYYTFEIGLTDFPTTRKVYWDDMGTISYLQGMETSPQWQNDNRYTYFPYAQYMDGGKVTYYFSDGTTGTSSFPFNRDVLQEYSGVWQNFVSTGLYSQSLDGTMIHAPMFPQNFMRVTSNFRNPIDNPNNYTTGYKVEAYGLLLTNEMAWSNNYLSGSVRSGFDTPEFGSLGYPYPIIFINDSGVTGSDASSTAYMWIRGASGGDVQVHFSQSDFIYPGSTTACASPYQIVETINDRLIGAGSTARAWLIKNPQFPNYVESVYGISPEDFSLYKGIEYNILIGDITDTLPTTPGIHILTKPGEQDYFGTKVAGESSCIGLGTGNYAISNSNPYATYTTGSNVFTSTYDSRTFEVDWSGYEGLYSDCIDCGYPRKQLMWKNKYGGFDYFTFTKQETITNDIERQQYLQSFVNYGTSTSILPFDKSRRGTTQYYNKITKRHILESDWITQGEADAIKELFFSTAVYELQKQNSYALTIANLPTTEYVSQPFSNYNKPLPQHQSSNLPVFQTQQVPIVVTNAQLVEKTNPRTQKLYKVSVEFVYANDLNARV